MKRLIIAILIMTMVPVLTLAQLKNQGAPTDIKKELLKPVQNILGLGFIDLSKMTMSHSMSLSFFSVAGNSLSQSLYLNTMNYQISDPLSLRLQWGIRNYPYSNMSKNFPAFRSGLFFSGAEINYRPSDKLFMRLQINTQPYLNYPYDNPFYDMQE